MKNLNILYILLLEKYSGRNTLRGCVYACVVCGIRYYFFKFCFLPIDGFLRLKWVVYYLNTPYLKEGVQEPPINLSGVPNVRLAASEGVFSPGHGGIWYLC